MRFDRAERHFKRLRRFAVRISRRQAYRHASALIEGQRRQRLGQRDARRWIEPAIAIAEIVLGTIARARAIG